MAERRPLATPKEVAKYLNVPEETLRQWRHRGGGPTHTKAGRLVRYKWADVDSWLTAGSKV